MMNNFKGIFLIAKKYFYWVYLIGECTTILKQWNFKEKICYGKGKTISVHCMSHRIFTWNVCFCESSLTEDLFKHWKIRWRLTVGRVGLQESTLTYRKCFSDVRTSKVFFFSQSFWVIFMNYILDFIIKIFVYLFFKLTCWQV